MNIMGYRIDLHVHTFHSGDNDADPEEIVERAVEAGLHGLAFTEHYSYEASGYADGLKEKYGAAILILRGVEFSAAEGHCLIFGVNTDRLAIKHAPIEEVIRVVSEAGGVVIPSHPFRGGNSVGDLLLDLPGITAVEGCNGVNMHPMNIRAIETAGRLRLPYTGGSDAHEPREVGSCYTAFEEKVTEENFIDRLRLGKYRGVDTRKISRMFLP